MFAKMRRGSLPANKPADFYSGLVKEADAKAVAAAAARDAAATEAERLDARVRTLEDELESVRATLDQRDRQVAELIAAHDAAAAERVAGLEARVRALSEERDAAIAAAEVVRSRADQHLAAMRGVRDGLRSELEGALEAIVGVAERHRTEVAAECRRVLRRAAEIGSGAEPHTDAALEGRRSAAASAPVTAEA